MIFFVTFVSVFNNFITKHKLKTMKKILILLLAVLIGATPLYAQNRDKKRKSRSKYTSEECIGAFVNRMNTNAKLFGMEHSHFTNAAGMANKEHYSTASDMLRLLINATSYDKLMLYWSFEKFTLNVMGDNAREITVKSTYKGPKADGLREYYDIYGGKSGSWGAGKGKQWKNLAIAVKSKVDERWLVGCVISTEDNRFVAMRELLDWLEAKRLDPNTPDQPVSTMCAAATVLPLHSAMAYRDKNLVMVGKEPDRRRGPFSMTKLMTAIIALDYCLPDEIITIQEDDLQRGSGPKFYDGDKLTMEEALIGLMLPSSNTLAKAISRHVGEKILSLQNPPKKRK